jgi:electron transfer flavoprotein alpha/beta subunit
MSKPARHGATGRCQAAESSCRREEPGLVFVGKQAIDDDCNQTGQMLAALAWLGAGHLSSSWH